MDVVAAPTSAEQRTNLALASRAEFILWTDTVRPIAVKHIRKALIDACRVHPVSPGRGATKQLHEYVTPGWQTRSLVKVGGDSSAEPVAQTVVVRQIIAC